MNVEATTQARPTTVAGKAAPVVTSLPKTNAGAHLGSSAGSPRVSQEVKPAKLFHVDPARAHLADHVKNDWFMYAPAGATPEDVDMSEEVFALIAHNLTRFDTITMAFPKHLVELVVIDAGPGYAVPRVVRVLDLPERRGDLSDRCPAGFRLFQGGPEYHDAWLIEREKDGVILNADQRHTRREDAIRFLLDHNTLRHPTPTIWGKT